MPHRNSTPPIRLAALDLDETLVGPSLTFTPRVRAAVAAVLARGVAVTIVTGRGPSPTDQFAAELSLNAPLVCFQGGVVYDYRTRQTLHERRLDPGVIPVVVQLAAEHGWNLQFETSTMIYLPADSDHPQVLLDLMRVAPWTRVGNFLTDLPEVPHKFILSVHDPAERDALVAEAQARLKAAGLGLTVVASHPILVEGLPLGLNKAQGLAWLAGHLGVPQAAVLAVGDNDNDAAMLAWAGVGVAMGNASPAARAAAGYVAPSVAEDGAAVALEHFVLGLAGPGAGVQERAA